MLVLGAGNSRNGLISRFRARGVVFVLGMFWGLAGKRRFANLICFRQLLTLVGCYLKQGAAVSSCLRRVRILKNDASLEYPRHPIRFHDIQEVPTVDGLN